jgi:hypothetical protein
MKLYPLLLHFSLILLDKNKKSLNTGARQTRPTHKRSSDEQKNWRRILCVEEESLLVVFSPRHPPGPGAQKDTHFIDDHMSWLSKKNQPK